MFVRVRGAIFEIEWFTVVAVGDSWCRTEPKPLMSVVSFAFCVTVTGRKSTCSPGDVNKAALSPYSLYRLSLSTVSVVLFRVARAVSIVHSSS